MKPLVDDGGGGEGGDFRVSFVADARGAELCSKRLPGFKIRLPANSLEEPTRIFARAITTGSSTLRLMDGECQASKILNFSPLKFATQIELSIPCIVPESRDHDVLVLMSSDRVSWRQIRANLSHEEECVDSRRVRLDHLPSYIGLYTRHRMTSLTVDGGGGQLPTHDDRARVHFPPGALTKLTTVMVQTFPVPAYLWPRGVKTGPIMTLEPRRRRFHANVDYHVAVPPVAKGDYHCRLLCSISEGMSTTEWKDITESVELNWTESDVVFFMSNLSGRFWMVFFEKSHFSMVDHNLFIHHARQIYANAITPAYAVQV